MSGGREPEDRFWGSALNGAVEVSVDADGHVVSVELDPEVVPRLWPEQLGDGVVQAHADARAAVAMGG